jgi:hypothetical protein
MAFATADDFAARLGIDLTDPEKTRAGILLGLASELIQDEVDQQIGLVADDTIELPGTTDDRITLPQRPVVSVSSVSIDGQALTEGGDWYLEEDTIIRVSTPLTILDGGDLTVDPYAYPYGLGFGLPEQTIAITYTHGFADNAVPGTVKAICLEAVVRAWVNPGSVARESIGNTSTVYDNNRFSPSGLLLNGGEIRKLRKLFPRHAGSARVGGGA